MTYNRHIPKDVSQKALDVWGKNAQILMVLEEMSELQKEILKNINRGKDNIKEIAEETADVFIMSEQLVHIYGIDKEVQKQAEYKVNCIKERLKEK